MEQTIQMEGLDRFLTTIYGESTGLASMLEALGFEPEQSRMLTEEHRGAVAAQFVEAIRKKLTSGDLDLWFRILNRRYGLDGEPAASIEEAAQALHIDVASATSAENDALQKCRYKTTLQDLKKELHRIALAELSQGGGAPEKAQVVGKLKRLADLKSAVDLTRMDYEAKRLEILKKVQAELDALEAEYEPILEAAQENASTLEGEIKNDVLLGGESVVTDVLQAIYVKGRVSWDNAGIDRYARAHPEVLKYRKEGAAEREPEDGGQVTIYDWTEINLNTKVTKDSREEPYMDYADFTEGHGFLLGERTGKGERREIFIRRRRNKPASVARATEAKRAW